MRAATLLVTLTLALTALAHQPAHAADHAPYIDWTPYSIAAKPDQPRGFLQFQRSCSVCHGSGQGKPGSRALAAKYKGSSVPALLEERSDLQAAYIKQVVRQGLNVMPIFRKTELSDADLDAIAVYLTRSRK